MAAIETASQINEIGFPEFTSKLVKDTFDTLVASQIDQVEAFAELVQETSKSLSTYINDTADGIGGEQIFGFIENVLPNLPQNTIQEGNAGDTPLNAEQATAIDNAVTVTENDDGGSPIQPTATITPTSSSEAILNAVATRIAANKYSILLEIVQTGLIRLVVTDGVIESKLNFRTYEYARAREASSSYNRSSSGRSFGARGSFFKGIFGLRGSRSRSSLSVSTSSSSSNSGSGTNINIQGLVRINFKSDYRPLNADVSA